MGHNFPPAAEAVYQAIADLESFTAMLPPQDRLIFSKFTEYALNQRAAVASAASLLPLEAALIILLLEEHKATQRLYAELCAEIERLKDVSYQLDGSARSESEL